MAFDLTVEKRDPKNGRIISSSPYTRYASSDGVVYFRDGAYYTESGQLASEDMIKRVVGREAKLDPASNSLKK
jgi:hypothetical protein